MTHWYPAKTFSLEPFDLIVDWTYEHFSLRDCFDDTVSDIADMARRCDAGIDTHYITRVRVLWNGLELGSSSLGSCYAYDCYPEDDIRAGISGYLDDMIDEAMDEAQAKIRQMGHQIRLDFPELDTAHA